MGNENSAFDDDDDDDTGHRLRLAWHLMQLEAQLRAASLDDVEQGWDPEDCSDEMIVSDDGKTVTRKVTEENTSDMVRAKKGYDSGIHIWEINWKIEDRGPNAVIGVATYQAEPLSEEGHVSLCGSNDESLGWDIVRNVAIFNGTVVTKYPENENTDTFKAPEIISVILNMDDGSIGFKAGCDDYGVALRGLKLFSRAGKELYPAVSATKNGAKVGFKYLGNALHPSPSSDLKMTQSTHEPLKFSQQYKGSHVNLSGEAATAEREDFMSTADNGVVLTSRPLLPSEKFEIKVDRTVSKWELQKLKFGVISVNPGFTVPSTVTCCEQNLSWIWSGSIVLHGGGIVKKLDHSLDNLKIGDKVAVMTQANGCLHFFLNDKDLGLVTEGVPHDVYGVVDINGCTLQVTIATSDRVSTPPVATMSEEKRIYHCLENVIEMMKEKKIDKIEQTLKAIETDLLNVYDRHRDSIIRQKICDKFAEMGGAQAIVEYWKFIDETYMCYRRDVVINCYRAIRNVCWNFSDASLKLALELVKCGLIGMLATEINELKHQYQDRENDKYLMVQNLAILQNCAKPAENHPYYTEHKIREKLQLLTDPSHHGFVNIVAIMTISYIAEHLSQPDLSGRLTLVTDMANLLKEAVGNNRHRATLNYGDIGSNITALELATSFARLAAKAENQVLFVNKGVIIYLVSLMDKGNAREQECAANCVWSLISPKTRQSIAETPNILGTLDKLGNSDRDAVKQAATRATLKLTDFTKRLPSAAPHNRRRGVCQYRQRCYDYLQNHLKIADAFLDDEYDMCYCTDCHTERNDKLYYTRGQPLKDFGIPIGWVRYGLAVHKKWVTAKDIFGKWHRAYHGVKHDNVKEIVDSGQLLMPGDYTSGGKKLREREGHFTDDRKPKGFDTKKIFVSPSIRYAGHDAYATPHRYKDTDGKVYKARVAFMVCIDPESYDVGNETVGLGAFVQIDPIFSNQEIEWSTKNRGAILLYGLLVKLEDEI